MPTTTVRHARRSHATERRRTIDTLALMMSRWSYVRLARKETTHATSNLRIVASRTIPRSMHRRRPPPPIATTDRRATAREMPIATDTCAIDIVLRHGLIHTAIRVQQWITEPAPNATNRHVSHVTRELSVHIRFTSSRSKRRVVFRAPCRFLSKLISRVHVLPVIVRATRSIPARYESSSSVALRDSLVVNYGSSG